MKSLRFITILIFLLCAEAYLLSNVFPAILALLIATYILYIFFEFDPKIEAKREVERTLYEGKRAEIKLIVKNPTKKSYRAKLFENPSFGKTYEFFIKPGDNEFSYFIAPSKGFYKIKGLLEIWDSRKIFKKSLKLGELEIEVLPSIESIREGAMIRANFSSKSLFGSPADFHSLREFQIGDDLRRIEWKASARLGELIVKEFVKEWEGDIYVVFDASREMRKKLEFSLSVLSQLLISLKGKRVGLVLHDEIGIKKIVEPREPIDLLKEINVSPIKGDLSLKISDLRISKYMRLFLRKIPSLSLSLIKNLPRKSLLIFLSDLSNPDELMRVFIEVKKDCKVIVISPNPVLFYRGEMDEEIILRLYREYLRREEIIKKLNRIVPTIDIGPNDFKKVML